MSPIDENLGHRSPSPGTLNHLAFLFASPVDWIVDDVLTTGSTSDACAKALLRAGAERVELICFARVVRPSLLER